MGIPGLTGAKIFSLSKLFFFKIRDLNFFSKIPPDTSANYLILKIMFPLLLHT